MNVDEVIERLFSSKIVSFPRVTRTNDPQIIRDQIACGCHALGLDDDQRQECEAEGLAEYWGNLSCSNARAVSVGMAMARKMARENSP